MVEVAISSMELAFVKRYASQAEIGGRSAVRGADRQMTLQEDQVIGMMGNYAINKYLSGNAHSFRLSRHLINQYPTMGDSGSDVPGLNVDIKTSLVRTEMPYKRHSLVVRSAERHAQTVYVLGLVPPERDKVLLMGWAVNEELKPITTGIFTGAWGLQADALHPMMPLRWF